MDWIARVLVPTPSTPAPLPPDQPFPPVPPVQPLGPDVQRATRRLSSLEAELRFYRERAQRARGEDVQGYQTGVDAE